MVAFAQVLRYAAVFTLGSRWNVRIVVWPGKAPVTSGPYRFMRHPNYVAVVLEVLFVPLVHGAFWTATVFSACNAVLLWVRIRAEEALLSWQFGDEYDSYCARTSRLVPGLY